MIAMLVIACAITTCASDDAGDAPAIVAEPSAVPAGATLIESERTVGAREPGPDARRLASMSCGDELMTITTDRETIYAELPCEKFATPEHIDRFRDVGLRVTVRPAESQSKLIIESTDGASLEFTIGHAWVVD